MAVPTLESGRFKILFACLKNIVTDLRPSGTICSNLKKNILLLLNSNIRLRKKKGVGFWKLVNY